MKDGANKLYPSKESLLTSWGLFMAKKADSQMAIDSGNVFADFLNRSDV
jgi:hypothetical protein